MPASRRAAGEWKTMKQPSYKELMLVTLVVGLGVVMYVQYNRGAFSRSAGTGSAAVKVKEVEPPDLPALQGVDLGDNPQARVRELRGSLFNFAKSPAEIRA